LLLFSLIVVLEQQEYFFSYFRYVRQ